MATQAMDITQLTQLVRWLEAERRKDRAIIQALQEKVESQANELTLQARRINELEGRLAQTRAELTRFKQIEQAIEQLREELTQLVERNEVKRLKAEQEMKRLREVEREDIARQLGELRKMIRPLLRLPEDLTSLRTEDSRLNGMIMTLQQAMKDLEQLLESRTEPLAYLDEHVRQNNRRIQEIAEQIPPLYKQLGELEDKLPLLEQGIQRKNKAIDEAAELLQQQAQLIEAQRVDHFRWEQQAAEWAELVEEIQKKADLLAAQSQRFVEQREEVRRALARLQEFQERLAVQMNEVAERQRLAEERQKRALEEWQAERARDWKHFTVLNDERWRENARHTEKIMSHISAIKSHLPTLYDQIQALWEVEETWAQTFMVGPREWLAHWNDLVKRRIPTPELEKPTRREQGG